MNRHRMRLKWLAFLRWLGFGRTDAHYILVGRQKLVWHNDTRTWKPVGRRFWLKHWSSAKGPLIDKYTPDAAGSGMEQRVIAVREHDYTKPGARRRAAEGKDAP